MWGYDLRFAVRLRLFERQAKIIPEQRFPNRPSQPVSTRECFFEIIIPCNHCLAILIVNGQNETMVDMVQYLGIMACFNLYWSMIPYNERISYQLS